VSSFTDKDNDLDALDIPLPGAGHLQDANRRRFSRNALVSSAVLLSLANRSAWGAAQIVGTMSVPTLDSFGTNNRMAFASVPGGTTSSTAMETIEPGRNVDLAKEIHRIADPPSYLGTDGTYTTCKDPGSINSIVLIKGKKCP